MAAATSPSNASEAERQKQALLVMHLPLESWSTNVPLGKFEGVTVDETGLVVKINLRGRDIELKVDTFAPLKSLKELNLAGCVKATGELRGPERAGVHVWAQISAG